MSCSPSRRRSPARRRLRCSDGVECGSVVHLVCQAGALTLRVCGGPCGRRPGRGGWRCGGRRHAAESVGRVAGLAHYGPATAVAGHAGLATEPQDDVPLAVRGAARRSRLDASLVVGSLWRRTPLRSSRGTPRAPRPPARASRTACRRGSGRPPPSPRRAGTRRRPGACGGSGRASITPTFQRRCSASAAQCASRPQPIWRSGNGSRASNASARIAVTGPISTKRVRRAVSPGRRRVTSQAACEANACAGWARRKPWCSASEMKTSRKSRGSSTSSSMISSQSKPRGGWASSAALRLAHLPAPSAGGTSRSSASWCEAPSSRPISAAARAFSGRTTESTSTRRLGSRAPPSPAAGGCARSGRSRAGRAAAPRAARGARACRSARSGSPGRA